MRWQMADAGVVGYEHAARAALLGVLYVYERWQAYLVLTEYEITLNLSMSFRSDGEIHGV